MNPLPPSQRAVNHASIYILQNSYTNQFLRYYSFKSIRLKYKLVQTKLIEHCGLHLLGFHVLVVQAFNAIVLSTISISSRDTSIK